MLGDIGLTGVAGTVLYGGPHCFDQPDVYPWLVDEAEWVRRCIDYGIPVLGFCLGAQIVAGSLGARVGPPAHGYHEFGYYPLRTVDDPERIVPDGLHVTQAHYHEFEVPQGARRLSRSDLFENQAFQYGDRTYGFQFHAEITYASFRRWQDADWAAEVHEGRPGTQTRAEQDRLAAEHDATQDAWFNGFLKRVFETQAVE